MQVLRDARARGSAFVDPGVDALGLERHLHQVGREFGEFPEGGRALGRVIVEEAAAGFAEGDQQAPVGVGVGVEEDEALAGADDDVVLFVLGGGGSPVVAEE